MLTLEKFRELMSGKTKDNYSYGDLIFNGLAIMRKYIPGATIEAAEHDEIFSVSEEELVAAGITEEDTIILRDLYWRISYNSLAHFV